jgi:hypothetical protein
MFPGKTGMAAACGRQATAQRNAPRYGGASGSLGSSLPKRSGVTAPASGTVGPLFGIRRPACGQGRRGAHRDGLSVPGPRDDARAHARNRQALSARIRRKGGQTRQRDQAAGSRMAPGAEYSRLMSRVLRHGTCTQMSQFCAV